MAADPAIALLQDVLQPNLDRIDAEMFGDFVDLRFAREACLRVAETAKCAGTQFVCVNDLAGATGVRNAVGRRRNTVRTSSRPDCRRHRRRRP